MLTCCYSTFKGILKDEFGLVDTVKSKPVLGPDDVLLLLTYLWARDTCIFPTEDQRESLAAIKLLSTPTGCRPAELVDGSRRKVTRKYLQSNQGTLTAKSKILTVILTTQTITRLIHGTIPTTLTTTS
jgi:hypothetical protein